MKKIISLLKGFVLCLGVFQIQTSVAQEADALPKQNAVATQTGVWQQTITWNGTQRKEVFNVPVSYNPSKKYKLIVGLHGLQGDPSGYISYFGLMCGATSADAYPDQCGGGFKYPTIKSPVFDNFIIACPQATGTNTDFWTPAADTGLITRIITDAMSMYNIDPNYIYLNGESLGGRAALAYGLYNWWRFRGLILWVPAIQGMSEALGGTMTQTSGASYQYQNAKRIPINFEVAATDGLLYNDVEAYKQCYSAGGIVNNQTLYPYCHAPSPDEFTFNAIDFIDRNATTHATNDAGIYNILSPLNAICSGSFTPKVVIQNKGIGTLSSATVNYQVDGGSILTYNWTGNLKQLERNTITLPAQSVAAGTHTFKVYTSSPNGASDNVPSNDQQTISFNYITNGAVSNFSEGFEEQTKKLTGIFQTDWRAPAGWRQAGTDSAFFWQLDTVEGSKGSAACLIFCNSTQAAGLSAPDNAGVKSDLITPEFDFTNATAPVFTYDYAYSPMTLSGSLLADSLALKYSTDCGTTWTKLFEKGGVALNTWASTTWGDKSNGAFFDPAGPSEWKTETVNLSSLVGKPNVTFAIENVCGKGNFLYLDNINLTGATAIADPQQNASISVYPNPSNGQITIKNEGGQTSYKVEIYNVLGENVFHSTMSNPQSVVDISSQPNGIYLMNIITGKESITQKLIIEK